MSREPEPEPELMAGLDPQLEPARRSAAMYAETDTAFGALLKELQAVQARCKERIEAKVRECLSSKQVQLEIREWVRAYVLCRETCDCQHADIFSVTALHV